MAVASDNGRSGSVREQLLHDNPIVDIWRIAQVANYYVFPMFKEFDSSLGLSRAEFVSLLCLVHGKALTAQEIVVGSGLPKNNISRAVRLLESKGLLTREKNISDQRSNTLFVTDAGGRLLDTCLTYAKRRQAKVMAALTADEHKQFQDLILKLCDSLADWAEMETIIAAGDERQPR